MSENLMNAIGFAPGRHRPGTGARTGQGVDRCCDPAAPRKRAVEKVAVARYPVL